MNLVITIPCLNEEKNLEAVIKEIPRNIEGISSVKVLIINDGSTDNTVEIAKNAGADNIISNTATIGLARTFKKGLETALKMGADIIVNTDGDNHYNQSRIPDLIKPILEKKADIVVAGRDIWNLEHMPMVKKIGNHLGSKFIQTIARIPKDIDASSGFRAYTKEAALKINILSDHTYAHESLIQAQDNGLIIKNVTIPARDVDRPSRLISSVPKHIFKSLLVILRVLTIYKPLRVMSFIASIFIAIGLVFVSRFLYFFFTDGGEGHIQSLILATSLMVIGCQIAVLGLLSSAIGWNRKILEENLFRTKKQEINQ